MSRPVVAFFNSQGGVGKTTLVYHLVWMYADLGLRVLAVDLDPQANLTMALLNEARLESLWNQNGHANTIYGSFESRISHPGTGTGASSHLEYIGEDQLSFSIGSTGLAFYQVIFRLLFLKVRFQKPGFSAPAVTTLPAA
ncbi:MAG TPA: ParA family protein [Ktedonobacteraceae bacterium]|nr:ParA family protein [Ktedonobacteraceae bacterium]